MYAQEKGKRIYPVVIEDAELPTQLHFLLVDVDRVDIRVKAQYMKLFRDLCNSLGKQSLDELTNMPSCSLPSRDVHRARSRGIDESFWAKCKEELRGMKMSEHVYIISVSAILLGGAYLLAKLFVWWAFER